MEPSQIKEELKNFHGTEVLWKFPFGCHFTDGVKFVAESCGAWWLIALIAAWANDTLLEDEEFLVFELKVYKDRTALVTVSDGNNRVLVTEALDYTDFPLDSIILWSCERIILLPSEY